MTAEEGAIVEEGAEIGLVLINLVAGVKAVAGIVTRERFDCAP